MNDPLIRDAGVIVIDGKTYRMVRKGSAVAYNREFIPEPPYSQGQPNVLSEQSFTWHLGGFKSRQGIPGTSEYGVNTDGRWPFRLAPSALIQTLEVAGNSDPITWYWKSVRNPALLIDAPLYFVAGDKAYRTNSTAGLGLEIRKVYDDSNAPVMGVDWDGYGLLVAEDGKIYKRSGVASETEVPTGAGATTQWTPSAGSNWQNVDDAVGAPDADSTYNESSTAGHMDLFTKAALTNPSAPGAPNRVSLVGRFRRTSATGTNPTVRFVLRIGGVNYFSSAITISSTSYGDDTVRYTLKPSDSTFWSKTDIDNAEIGYELTTAPGAGAVRCTQFYVEEEYTSWSTNDALANWLAVGPRRLFKVYNDSGAITLKNLSPGLDPSVETNWADEVIIPGSSVDDCRPPLVALQRTAVVATNFGVFGIDEDGSGVKIYERLNTAPYTMAVQDPWLYISHAHGLSRWLPGLVEDCGLEQEIMNSGPITGVIRAIGFLGPWIYAALTPQGGNGNVLVGRERRSGEPGLGPIVWDTFLETGETNILYALYAGKFTGVLNQTEYGVVVEVNGDFGYIILPATGGIPEIDSSSYKFATSGSRFTVKYRFDDWHDKTLYKIDVKGVGLDDNTFWEIAYSIDGGSWVTVDADSADLKITDDELNSFYLPATATGIEFQFRFTYTGESSSVKGELVNFEPHFIPQAQKIPLTTVQLQLQANQQYPDGRELRTAEQQLSDLAALVQTSPVSVSGPWGDGVEASVRGVTVDSVEQQGSGEYTYLVKVQLQERSI